MNRYYTIMIVPERDKGVKTFRIPRLIYRSLAFMTVIFSLVLAVVIYDYWQIVQQVYQNKHLTIENRELREQIQLFQMKINALTRDINRIQTFEKKLRVITGLESIKAENSSLESDLTLMPKDFQKELIKFKSQGELKNDKKFKNLKTLYDQRIASIFGLQSGYAYTKDWNRLTQRSFNLSSEFSYFDFKYDKLQSKISDLEIGINQLDQFLLDKKSFLKSTPSILPTRGWITSYFGPRKSPHSGRLKMHEGLDIGGDIGTPIIAPADGLVTYSGKKAGFGKFVQIDHGYGIETIFGHAHKLFVHSGQKISRGDKIAAVGNTGMSTGPHLHYEVRINGIAVDPLYFILD